MKIRMCINYSVFIPPAKKGAIKIQFLTTKNYSNSP